MRQVFPSANRSRGAIRRETRRMHGVLPFLLTVFWRQWSASVRADTLRHEYRNPTRTQLRRTASVYPMQLGQKPNTALPTRSLPSGRGIAGIFSQFWPVFPDRRVPAPVRRIPGSLLLSTDRIRYMKLCRDPAVPASIQTEPRSPQRQDLPQSSASCAALRHCPADERPSALAESGRFQG